MTHAVEKLRTAIANAPTIIPPIAPDLLGWWTPCGFYVCAPCAGRILARGCSLPVGTVPTWKDEPFGVCVTCTSEVPS